MPLSFLCSQILRIFWNVMGYRVSQKTRQAYDVTLLRFNSTDVRRKEA